MVKNVLLIIISTWAFVAPTVSAQVPVEINGEASVEIFKKDEDGSYKILDVNFDNSVVITPKFKMAFKK